MFDAKSPAVKIGGYLIIGFFVVIIIISFGMPDFMSRLGLDKSTVAVINGEKIHYLDFIRYRDNMARRFKDVNKKEIQNYILDSMIRYRLQLQKAKDVGIRVSDDRVKRYIKSMPMFLDDKGKFNNRRLNRFLDHYHLSLQDYYSMVREELLNNEVVTMMRFGVGVTPDEVTFANSVMKSNIQIKYSFVSNVQLKRKFSAKLAVADSEVKSELEKNRKEIKDPKTDRERIRKKLEDRKFEGLKKELIAQIDKLYLAEASFQNAAALLGGTVLVSQPFRIGQSVRSSTGKKGVLHTISESQIFVNDCLALNPGKTSRAISAFDGLYVFTPVKKTIPGGRIVGKEYAELERKLVNEKINSVYYSMMSSFWEKSSIRKNLNIK